MIVNMPVLKYQTARWTRSKGYERETHCSRVQSYKG